MGDRKEVADDVQLMNDVLSGEEVEDKSDDIEDDDTKSDDKDDKDSEASDESSEEDEESIDDESDDDEGPEGSESDDDKSDDSDSSKAEDHNPIMDVIAELKAEIVSLKAKLEGTKPDDTDDATESDDDSSPDDRAHLIDYFGDIDVEDIIEDKDSFNKFLNNAFTSFTSTMKNVIGEHVLKSIPEIVRTNIAAVSTLKAASEQFYSENEDLKGFKKVVASVYEEIASDNPDKNYKEVMTLVAPEARKRLGLQKQVKEKTKGKKSPRLPSKKSNSGNHTEKPNTNPLLKEIEDMNKILEG